MEFLRRLILPTVTVVTCGILYFDWYGLTGGLAAGAPVFWTRLFGVLFWGAVGILAVRGIDFVFWRGVVQRRSGRPPPRLLITLSQLVIWIVVLGFIAGGVFGQPVAGFVTTSSVAAAVLGFSLRDIIADVAYGLAMGFERPFKIGDWVEVGPARTVAQVCEISWRTTQLVTRDATRLTVPNSRFARDVIANIDDGMAPVCDRLSLQLAADLPAEEVERVLLAAAHDVPEVASGTKRPEARIAGFSRDGVAWELLYAVPGYGAADGIAARLRLAVLRHLHVAGMGDGLPRLAAQATDRTAEIAALLGRIDLFRVMPTEDRIALAGSGHVRLTEAGRDIVRQGEGGDGMYVILQGLVEVAVVQPGEEGRFVVGRIAAGGFFGEMSLLTGEPRKATVTAVVDCLLLEIHKADLEPLVASHPDLPRDLGRTLAERQLATAQALDRLPAHALEQKRQSLAEELFTRIRGFFQV